MGSMFSSTDRSGHRPSHRRRSSDEKALNDSQKPEHASFVTSEPEDETGIEKAFSSDNLQQMNGRGITKPEINPLIKRFKVLSMDPRSPSGIPRTPIVVKEGGSDDAVAGGNSTLDDSISMTTAVNSTPKRGCIVRSRTSLVTTTPDTSDSSSSDEVERHRRLSGPTLSNVCNSKDLVVIENGNQQMEMELNCSRDNCDSENDENRWANSTRPKDCESRRDFVGKDVINSVLNQTEQSFSTVIGDTFEEVSKHLKEGRNGDVKMDETNFDNVSGTKSADVSVNKSMII